MGMFKKIKEWFDRNTLDLDSEEVQQEIAAEYEEHLNTYEIKLSLEIPAEEAECSINDIMSTLCKKLNRVYAGEGCKFSLKQFTPLHIVEFEDDDTDTLPGIGTGIMFVPTIISGKRGISA